MNKTFNFILNVEPMPLNHTHINLKGGRRIKSNEFRLWEYRAQNEIAKCFLTIADLRIAYNKSRHCIKANYTFFVTQSKLMTKKKCISKKSGDVDNFIKPINDQFFSAFEIDDSQVYSVSAIKLPSSYPKITASFEIIDIESIPHYKSYLNL